MVRGERQGQEHKQQKRRLLEIIRTQFSYHIEPWITNTLEKQDSDLKSHPMMMIEDFKKDINNSLKETHENTGKLSIKSLFCKSCLGHGVSQYIKSVTKIEHCPLFGT
jgi:hypothetical protein